MGLKKDDDELGLPALDELEASSGPRAKAADDLLVLIALLKQRTMGLEPDEIEDEIDRFFEQMIARHARVVPEKMKGEHRELLRNMLEEDPTVRQMRDDLRRSLTGR